MTILKNTKIPAIMVVENSISVRELICFILKEEKYKVIEAGDGKEALDKINSGFYPDLVFTDLNMPNMNGFELIKKIRAKPSLKFIPVVVVTTEYDALKKQEAKAAGASAWITKPFKKEQLLSVVKKFFD